MDEEAKNSGERAFLTSPLAARLDQKPALPLLAFDFDLCAVYFYTYMYVCVNGLPWWLRQERICLQCGRPDPPLGQEDPLEKGIHCVVLFGRSVVSDSVTRWTPALQAPLSMGFSSQEYWSGLPFCPPGNFPNPEFELESFVSPALAGGFFTTRTTWEALI